MLAAQIEQRLSLDQLIPLLSTFVQQQVALTNLPTSINDADHQQMGTVSRPNNHLKIPT